MNHEEAKKHVLAYIYMECENMPEQVIKALEVFRLANEKQIPKKPIIINYNGKKIPYCPVCKELLIKYADEDYKRLFQEDWCPMDYCDRCGQAILWEE